MPVENTRDDILRKVQALLAKAMSTPFEAEADSFRTAANNLMDKYRIEQWEIAKREAGMSKVIKMNPVRKDVSIAWWWEDDHGRDLWQIFSECAKLCTVVVAKMKLSGTTKSAPCYGLETDILFLEMLFTDLYVQMSNKIKPTFDPEKSLGFNVFQAKEAGMKYRDIAIWAGHPEWIRIKGYGKKGYPLYEYDGIMIREMKKYAASSGLEIHKEISLDNYVEDFVNAYVWAVVTKMREMRTGEVRNTGSMQLVIKDITAECEEFMWSDFPDLRPHPDNCECDTCHFLRCRDSSCTRTRCVEARKPVKYRPSKISTRNISVTGSARGAQAGAAARIMQKQEAVTGKKPKPLGE